MLKQYLEKNYDMLLKEKFNLEKKLKQHNNMIKENKNFIYLLEQGMDKNYELFTPFDVNHREHEKVLNLEIENNNLLDFCKKLQLEILENSEKILEIDKLIKELKNHG
ncbi:hypothetical protein LQZ18_14540 [Lachnospiraceae bacterium ZAX-1]